MAPPTQGIPTHCRYPAATLAALDALAERKGMSRAELLRVAADEMIAREKGKK